MTAKKQRSIKLRVTVPQRPIYDELWDALNQDRKHAGLILLEFAAIGIAAARLINGSGSGGNLAALLSGLELDKSAQGDDEGDESFLDEISDELDDLAF